MNFGRSSYAEVSFRCLQEKQVERPQPLSSVQPLADPFLERKAVLDAASRIYSHASKRTRRPRSKQLLGADRFGGRGALGNHARVARGRVTHPQNKLGAEQRQDDLRRRHDNLRSRPSDASGDSGSATRVADLNRRPEVERVGNEALAAQDEQRAVEGDGEEVADKHRRVGAETGQQTHGAYGKVSDNEDKERENIFLKKKIK